MSEKIQKHKHLPYLIGGILIVSLIMSWVGFIIFEHNRYVSTNDAFIDSYRIDLAPDILSRIVALEVDEGDLVHQGQVVAVLQQDIFHSQKVEAKAALESALYNISVEKAHLEKVQADYFRATKGIQDQIISSQTFDHIQKDFEKAEATYNKSIADAELAKTRIALINTYLNHTYIYAPFDGVIAKRWVFTGDVMRPGQALFTMYDHKRIWIQANLSEKKIKKVQLGARVEISIDAYPDRKFYGKVFTVKSAAASQFSVIPQNNATGNYTKVAQRIPLKISLEYAPSESQLYLFPGMNCEVKINILDE